MACNLNEDVISEILEQLWALHTQAWDSEFRPEALRRFYSNYSLVSNVWTLPSQRYVYRNAHLVWGADFASFEAGIKNPLRGQVLKESVRVLYLYISHSSMGISIQKLDKILNCCPNLIDLRLSTGPEINTLFIKPTQESRLRSSFLALRPTLRALQVRMDGRSGKKIQIMKQLGELAPFSTLDFLSITSKDADQWVPRLNPEEWDVRTDGWTSINWPLETNADTIPLRSVLEVRSDEEESNPLTIHPRSLRFNASQLSPYSPHSFLELLGSRLDQVMCGTMLHESRWNNDCETIVSSCPNLEQLILLDCYSHKYQRPTVPRLYVLEPQDWHVAEEKEDTPESPVDEDTPLAASDEVAPASDEVTPASDEVATASDQGTPASASETPETRVLALNDRVRTASHMVSFVEKVSAKWMAEKNTIEYRKEPVFDRRWPQEALTGLQETRTAEDMRHNYATSWSDTLVERHAQYVVAVRRPSTLPAPGAES